MRGEQAPFQPTEQSSHGQPTERSSHGQTTERSSRGLSAWWRSLWRRGVPPTERVAWIRRPSGLAVVQLAETMQDGLPVVLRCQFFPEPLSVQELSSWLRHAGLRGARAVGVLDRDAYLLFPAEAPALPRHEWGLNLRWKIADRLGYPAEQAVVECFPLPEGAGKGESARIYLAVARRQRLQEEIALFAQVGLQLQRLDILDLALGRLTDHLPESAEGLALLSWSGEGVLITLRRQRLLYLARLLESCPVALWPQQHNLPSVLASHTTQSVHGLQSSHGLPIPSPFTGTSVAPEGPVVPAAVQELAMELHRTLHFYQRSFAQPAVAHLFLLPAAAPCQLPEAERLRLRQAASSAAGQESSWPGLHSEPSAAGRNSSTTTEGFVFEQLEHYLATRLGLSVYSLPLEQLLRWQTGVDEEQLSCCLPAIGALLGSAERR
ncbi:hypothetical protein [Candidatus Magnetaquicoccus inordinatus]|uniref:hypothetical protein n=1 Tax=Candidatus Magnetaquicoccus inordinatus TaxID=2496818 RepID=UPI00102C3720|nr:hypothetical protein [Candidatus Magnetaquicoccus inordinatus]